MLTSVSSMNQFDGARILGQQKKIAVQNTLICVTKSKEIIFIKKLTSCHSMNDLIENIARLI